MLTRVDGDGRGGAALSMRAVTGKPIKLMGVGEKWDALEDFHPSRVAGRILGMGDVVSLVERAAETIDVEKAKAIAQKMRKGAFDLDDLAEQLKQMQRLGGMGGVMGMLPGMGKIKQQMAAANIDDSVLKRQGAIISSMTPFERRNPKHARRQAQAAHRGRLRHPARGHQQADQDAPPDGGHDEDDGQEPRHDGEDGRCHGHGRRHGRNGWRAECGRDRAHAGGARKLDPKALEQLPKEIRDLVPPKGGGLPPPPPLPKGGGLPGFGGFRLPGLGGPKPTLPGLPGGKKK